MRLTNGQPCIKVGQMWHAVGESMLYLVLKLTSDDIRLPHATLVTVFVVSDGSDTLPHVTRRPGVYSIHSEWFDDKYRISLMSDVS